MLIIKDDRYRGLDALVDFLNRVTESQFEWYKELKEEYESTLVEYREYENTFGKIMNVTFEEGRKNVIAWRKCDRAMEIHRDLYGTNEYWEKRDIKGHVKKMIMFYTLDEIKQDLDKDAEIAFEQLVSRVEKRGGEVIDVVRCDFGLDGSVNSVIRCVDKMIEVVTIIASGPVQRAHYRVLVKVFKEKKNVK